MKRLMPFSLILCAAIGATPIRVHAHPATVDAPMNGVICVGDANLDDAVMVDELLKGVNGLLGRTSVPPSVDANGDGDASISELVMAVGFALRGCPPARFVPADCEVPPPPGQDPDRVRCGFLIVPEHRPPRDGRTLQIATMVVPATGTDRQPDPIVFIDGGPGYRTLDNSVPFHDAARLAPLIGRRDVVYFDPRGVGRSRPNTDCPEIDEARLASFGRSQPATADAADEMAASHLCRDRLVAMGVDLEAFSSANIVRDVDALVAALGYEHYNLLGTSYGARIALTAAREVPERVRSIAVDIPVPVDQHIVAEGARNGEEALDRVLAMCAANPSCNAAYPDLGQTIFDVAQQLETAPLMLSFVDPAGVTRPFVLTSDRFLLVTLAFVGASEFTYALPAFVTEVAAGGGAITNLSVQGYSGTSPISWGMRNSIWCYEHVAFLTPEVISDANSGVSDRLARLFLESTVQFAIEACPIWRIGPSPAFEHEPIVSDLPTLILTGEFDPAHSAAVRPADRQHAVARPVRRAAQHQSLHR